MSKRVLITLIVSMAVVMGGLIFVQTNSILKASEIKEEQFDQTVRQALFQVAKKLEIFEVQKLLHEELYDNPTRKNAYPGSFGSIIPRGLQDPTLSISFTYSQTARSFQKEIQFQFSDTIAASGLNTRGNPGDFPSAFDKLHDYNIQQQRMLERRMSDNAQQLQKLFFRSRPIEERIDPKYLAETLNEELRNHGINLEYRYAVKTFPPGTEKYIMGSADYKPNNRRKEYPSVLFPNDVYEVKPNYLVVYFPNRSGYLLLATGIMVIPTFILTTLLIAIFVYTILIIFKQKKLSQIKNDFINNMTHELKTPISTISLASQMLQDGTFANTPKTIEHISQVINQESKRLSFQVEKVLQMAIFNEGRMKLRFKEFSLNELVSSVISNFELRVRNQNGVLNANLNATDDIIYGDEVHITNVVFNLLDNAVKYSQEIPEITVSTSTKNDAVILSVADKGIGIPKEHQTQIFERFFRVPTGNVHNVKGFGLGLSYVKKIIDAHNGKIIVESAPHKGTKFSIFFPLNKKK